VSASCSADSDQHQLSPQALRSNQSWARQVNHATEQLLRQGIEEEVVRPDIDLAVIANLLNGALTSIARWYRPADRLEPAQVAEQAMNLLRGLLTSAQSASRQVERVAIDPHHAVGLELLVRKMTRCSRPSTRPAGTPARAKRRWTMVFIVTGWDPTRQRTPSIAPGNWVIAAKVELQPRQRLNRPIARSRVSRRLRA
jgi:Tetracyclin repressor-like, C-terminal domain